MDDKKFLRVSRSISISIGEKHLYINVPLSGVIALEQECSTRLIGHVVS